jgi:hypothetical protein
MLYRQAGKTGQKLSILGFGCMRLPIIGGKTHQIDAEKAQAMVDYAIRNGVNYFDTAFMYHSEVPFQAGMSEVFLGQALKRERGNIHLATKLPSWFVESRADMDRFLDQQLERVHGVSGEMWQKLSQLGVREFLETALADGRIKHAGFSFHDDAPAFKPIVDAYDWSFCQIQYNFMDEDYQAGRAGLEYAASKGLGVIIMEPLRGGGLAAKVPDDVQAVWAKARVKRTPAEWALRFVWNRPETSVVLSGMSTLEQMEENVRLADQGLANSLTAAELALIHEAKAIYQARTRVNCTGCGYCLPCPHGVAIPANFLQLNNLSIYRDRGAAEFFYFHILKEDQRASHCEECGQCEELCPQHIPIPAMLKEVVREFESQRA